MKHKTWFRLVIKAIGVLLIGFSLPQFLNAVMTVVDALLIGERTTMYSLYGSPLSADFSWALVVSSLLMFFPPAAQVGFGLYLFFGGKWIVNKCIPSNRPYCPECGYDLSNSSAVNCPECGVSLPNVVPKIES